MQIQSFSVLLSHRNLPESRIQVQCSENLASQIFERLLSIRGFRYRKSQHNLSCLPFFLAMATPRARGDFEGFIISYSSSISVSSSILVQQFAFFLFNLMHDKKQQQISALCFEKKKLLRSDLKLPLATQTLLHLSLPLNCSFSGKTGLSDSNLYDDRRSGKFELLDRYHPFRNSLKLVCLKISFH